MKINSSNIALLLLPLVSGFATAYFCSPGKKAGKAVGFRPPAWIFSVVWPVLYLLMGWSWIQATKSDTLNHIPYAILQILLVAWLVVYGCAGNKEAGTWIIALSLLACGYCLILGNAGSRITLLPLVVWLGFALLMNAADVSGCKCK